MRFPPPPPQKAEKVTAGTCVVYSYAALALILCSELSLCVRDVTSSLPWQRVARLTDCVHSLPVIAPFITPMIVGVCLYTLIVQSTVHIVVFWFVTPCRLVGGYRRFGGTYSFHLQD
jgi:hypothetical protein